MTGCSAATSPVSRRRAARGSAPRTSSRPDDPGRTRCRAGLRSGGRPVVQGVADEADRAATLGGVLPALPVVVGVLHRPAGAGARVRELTVLQSLVRGVDDLVLGGHAG